PRRPEIVAAERDKLRDPERGNLIPHVGRPGHLTKDIDDTRPPRDLESPHDEAVPLLVHVILVRPNPPRQDPGSAPGAYDERREREQAAIPRRATEHVTDRGWDAQQRQRCDELRMAHRGDLSHRATE